jgi:hypothetical protein
MGQPTIEAEQDSFKTENCGLNLSRCQELLTDPFSGRFQEGVSQQFLTGQPVKVTLFPD